MEVFGISTSAIWFHIFIASVQGILQKKFNVTLYKGVKFTWNEAKCFCESKGSRLLAMDTEEKYEDTFPSLQSYMSYGRFYWTGLHTFRLDCSGYRWHNAADLGPFSAWDLQHEEPNDCIVDNCIRMSYKGVWRTSECFKKIEILCEDIYPKCTFDVVYRTRVRMKKLPDDATTILLNGNLTLCQLVCEQSTSNNYPCRGIIASRLQLANECTLLFINSATYLDDNDNLFRESADDLYVRRCVTVGMVELQAEDVKIIHNNDSSPTETACTEYNNHQVYSSIITTNSESPTTSTLRRRTDLQTKELRTTTDLQTTELTDQQTTNTKAVHITSSKDEDLNSKLATLISETKIEKTSTSTSLRSRISVMEDRTSAKSMGYLATIIVTCILGAIVISDIPILFKHVRKFWC